MLHGYREKEWYFYSKKYLPEIKKLFGYKPFRLSDITDIKLRSVFDDVFLGGGIEIVSSCMVDGKKDYIFRVFCKDRGLRKKKIFTNKDFINMVYYLSNTFKGKPFYLEDIPNFEYRVNFYNIADKRSFSDSDKGYSIERFFEGEYTDKNGVGHDCFYVPYPLSPYTP